jgi:CRISPR-associated protein Cmr4
MPATDAVPEPETTQAALLGIYTLTSTHCGTGKAMDAVDLPIAREEHTGHPVLPSSSIKGALRAAAERSKLPGTKAWFGPEINPGVSGAKEELYAGSVVFTDARLLAFPVRALHTAFCWVTCPLVLERFHRDLQAFGKTSVWPQKGALHPASDKWDPEKRKAHVAGELAALVLEDLAFSEAELVVDKDGLKAIAEAFGALLGPSEGVLRKRLEKDLIVVHDADFADLVTRTMPVQARIRLNDRKTTTGDGGNLWYEETLPNDALFSTFALARDGAKRNGDTLTTLIAAFQGAAGMFGRPVQVGGNETVGHGFCLWHVAQEVPGGR